MRAKSLCRDGLGVGMFDRRTWLLCSVMTKVRRGEMFLLSALGGFLLNKNIITKAHYGDLRLSFWGFFFFLRSVSCQSLRCDVHQFQSCATLKIKRTVSDWLKKGFFFSFLKQTRQSDTSLPAAFNLQCKDKYSFLWFMFATNIYAVVTRFFSNSQWRQVCKLVCMTSTKLPISCLLSLNSPPHPPRVINNFSLFALLNVLTPESAHQNSRSHM